MTALAKPVFMDWLDFTDFAVNNLGVDPSSFLEWSLIDFEISKKNIIETYKKKVEIETKNTENIVNSLAKMLFNKRN